MQRKTSLEALRERATATGYVTLEGMNLVLLEGALAEAETPDIDPKDMPKAEDYHFWKRCKVVDRIR
jgi:hypothetical protein